MKKLVHVCTLVTACMLMYGHIVAQEYKSLVTTYASGNSNDGIVFNIKALKDVYITTLDLNVDNGSAGQFLVYYRPESYVGFQNSSAGWIFMDSVNLATPVAEGAATPSGIGLNIRIPAGETYGFYLTGSGPLDLAYTNGTGVGDLYIADADIEVYTGEGMSYPFASNSAARVFNGTIHYSKAAIPSCNALFTTNVAGNGNTGVMFDITATNSVKIKQFDTRIVSGGLGVIYAYYIDTTLVGSETTAANWTFIDSAYVSSGAINNEHTVTIPINVTIPAGKKYGFFLYSPTLSFEYTDGSTDDAIYASNSDISIHEGKGLSGLFTNTFSPHVFNGTVRYCPTMPEACNWDSTTYTSNNGNRGNMFSIVTNKPIFVTSFSGNLNGTGFMKVYYKKGSYAGYETKPNAWILVDSARVTSNGVGVPTPIDINMSLLLNAGDTFSFYITGNGSGADVNYLDGTAEGAVYSTDGTISILEGVGKEYPFAGTFSPRIWNGTVNYCNAGAVIELGTDQTVCSNATTTLNVGTAGTGFNYAWSNAETTASVTLDNTDGTGNYAVTVTNPYGISTSDDVNITFHTVPVVTLALPQDTACTNANALVLSGGAPAGGVFSGTGVSGTTFNPSGLSAGAYPVTYTYSDGTCSNAASEDIVLEICTDVHDIEAANWKLYPNPTSGTLNIATVNTTGEPVNIQVATADGRLVWNKHYNDTSNVFTQSIDMSTMQAGMYIVKITTGETVTVRTVGVTH